MTSLNSGLCLQEVDLVEEPDAGVVSMFIAIW